MPPLPKIRTQALAELARQLRYESAEAARLQLGRTEALALEILTECGVPGSAAAARAGDKSYPLEYVIYRITGMRPEGAGEGAMLVGAALLGDLAALVERLSTAAGVTVEELPTTRAGRGTRVADGPWITLQELQRRWSVGRKTIERERRRGLIARRARQESGRRSAAALERVLVSERAIAAFEAAGGRLQAIAPDRKRTRITAEEASGLVMLASRCRARFGWSLSRCAAQLSRKHGRSAPAIARVLRKHDLSASSPIFGRRRAIGDSQRARVAKAAQRGGRVATIANKMGRSRAAGYRVVAADRLARLRKLDLDGPVGPLFDRADAEEVLLAPEAVRTRLGSPAPATVGETLVLADAMEAPDADVESARAVAMVFLHSRVKVWLAHLKIKERPSRGPTMAAIRAAEARLLWSSRLKAELVRSQLPVALRTARERLGGRDPRTLATNGPSSGPAFIAAMVGGIVEGVDRFDPLRGGRLAAATTIAVTRTIGAWSQGAGLEVRTGAAALSRAASRCDAAPVEDWTRRLDPWQAWLDAPPAIAALVRGSSGDSSKTQAAAERERRVLAMLYGLAGDPPRTPTDVARAMSTTAARVTAIERQAHARLGKPARVRPAK